MKKPVIHPSAFVADNATVRGSVTLGANSSVFFGAVLRGDRAPITIGAGTNIQDNCVVHVDYDHRERVCQDDFCKFSKFKYLSAEKSPNISCLHSS